jgi:hypothetical protein
VLYGALVKREKAFSAKTAEEGHRARREEGRNRGAGLCQVQGKTGKPRSIFTKLYEAKHNLGINLESY